MIRMFAIESLQPFKLFDLEPVEAPELSTVVSLQDLHGTLERSGISSVALPLRAGRTWLVLGVERRGVPVELHLEPGHARDTINGEIVFVATGDSKSDPYAAMLVARAGDVNRPWQVDRYYWEQIKRSPGGSDAKRWATAWSIYCKYKAPGSRHCRRPPGRYLVG